MHTEAYAWVQQHAPTTDDYCEVLDIGGRNINGSTRDLFRYATRYVVLDIMPGPNVDIVADAATWVPKSKYDWVVCTEVFEHTDVWKDICKTAFNALRSGGSFIITCAGPGRPPHSAIDGGSELHPGEFYGNVSAVDLSSALVAAGFKVVDLDQTIQAPMDTRALAIKP